MTHQESEVKRLERAIKDTELAYHAARFKTHKVQYLKRLKQLRDELTQAKN